MLSIIINYKNCIKKYVVDENLTILEIARKKKIDIEGSCEGALACSTCHILVEEEWINKIKPASIEEKEILELLPEYKKNSRLGCQLKITKSLDGIKITIPAK